MYNLQNYRKLAFKIHSWSKEKGFWTGDKENERVKRALIVTEIAEAIEADRKDHRIIDPIKFRDQHFIRDYEYHVKGTVEEELADVAIRTLDLWYYSVENPDKIEENPDWHNSIELFYQSSFPETMYQLMKFALHLPANNLLELISLILMTTDKLGRNLEHAIELKMKYNYLKDHHKITK